MFNKPNILALVKETTNTMTKPLECKVKDRVVDLFTAIFGFNLKDGHDSKLISGDERMRLVLKSLVALFLPQFENSLPIIEQYVRFLIDLLHTGVRKDVIKEALPKIAEQLGLAFGANTVEINGLIGVLQGDAEAIADFTAPFCKLNPDTIKTIIVLLTDTQSSLHSLEKVAVANADTVSDENRRSNYLALMRKVNERAADTRELFQLIDMDGDNSGGVSKEEFKALMAKLNIEITDHRVAEIFARCKSQQSKNETELDEKGMRPHSRV